ncbi:MAG: acetylornithine deacetylase [Gammaproteobacteria bacterium]|jgi:acetylornithine deacetylase
MARKAPGMLEMMRELIAAPSVSSVSPQFDMGNHGISVLIGNWLEDLGFSVEIQEIPDQPGKANVIAALGRGPGGLVLAGHTDTVPYDDTGWSQDPFRLTERDNGFYGLGTSDMKSFFALAIEAARVFEARDLAQPLIIVGTADEESSMSGGRALAAAGKPTGRHAIIGEPTGMRPVNMHKGIFMEAIRLRGRSGHSSDPSLGINALEGMHRVIAELLVYRDELQQQWHNGAFAVPTPTLNLGYVHGGDNPNRICPECELHIDLRTLPGMTKAEIRGELRHRVRRIGEGIGLEVEFESLFDGIDALATPTAADIVVAAEQLTGHAAEAVAFGSEGPFFSDMGMDTLIMGPGDIKRAHQPDECIDASQLRPGVEVLQKLIQRFCVEPAPEKSTT